MCKINGHSIFSYLTQPWNAQKLYTSNARANAIEKAHTDATEIISKNSEGQEVADTASTAKINNKKNNHNLSSLRVPLESNGVGASVASGTTLGLNLGG